jgi:hypothetical protein
VQSLMNYTHRKALYTQKIVLLIFLYLTGYENFIESAPA